MYFKDILKVDIVNQLKEIRAKTMIIAAKDDKVIPPKYSKILHKNIKNSELVCIAGSHGVIADNPNVINKLISDFLITK